MIARLAVAVAVLLPFQGAWGIGNLENPQPLSVQSGIGTISGWACNATAIHIQIDGGALLAAPYGSLRADTQVTCGHANTGFSYLFNYNTLPAGTHTIVALADGIVFALATFTTAKPAGEFLNGAVAGYFLNNFPALGQRTRVDWSQSKQNFSITSTDANFVSVAGTYYGAFSYTRVGCPATFPNGSFTEYAKWTVNYSSGQPMTITAAFTTNYSCSLAGIPTLSADGTLSVPVGTMACTNGGFGTWNSPRIAPTLDGITARVTLTFGSPCREEGSIGAARF